jgi:hypothetical protein
MDVREDWIQYMILHYRKIFPRYREEDYRRWASARVDEAAEKLGDYFSRSRYEKPKYIYDNAEKNL